MSTLPGKRFALILDEAHSSQTGEASRRLKHVLAASSLEQAEAEDEDEEDLDDRIEDLIRKGGRLPNVSSFAFTATPKPKTLEMFGTRRDDGSSTRSVSTPCARPLRNDSSSMCSRTTRPTVSTGAY